MNRFRRATAAVVVAAGLAIAVALGASVVGGASNDAIAGLAGTLAGGLIAVVSQVAQRAASERHQLRMAVVERRLQAPQEAYALWMRLTGEASDRAKGPLIAFECQQWWNSNCLYLSRPARDAFRKAFLAAGNHAGLHEARADAERIRANWADITAAGELLERSVELPPIGLARPPSRRLTQIFQ